MHTTHTKKASMSSSASGWISFWEHNLLDDQQHSEFEWNGPGLDDGTIKSDSFNIQCSSFSCTTENENSKGDSASQDCKKRARDDGPNGAQGKACREKMRRDRMNDRFVELSAVLEPDKPPKTDKASILRDAARVISHLRAEAQHYKEANSQLQEAIKDLKAEKNELREEKLSLKADKEKLENRLKMMHVIPGYTAQTTPLQRASLPSPTPPLSLSGGNHALYAKASGMFQGYAHYQNHINTSKHLPFPDNPFSATMSQWIPPEVADVSKDHVLRPPVA